MSLPKIDYQINEILVESLKKKVKFRPILVREEKLLLIAKQAENENDIFMAVKQVVTNCALEPLNVDILPLYELEHIFLQLRVQSIGGTIELSYHDNDDDQDYNFKIEVSDIKIERPEGSSPTIQVNDDIVLELRYPPASLYGNEAFLGAATALDSFNEVVYSSIVAIWEGETMHEVGPNYDRVELAEFVDSLPPEAYRKVQDFFIAVPHMHHKIEYKNKNGTDRTIVLRTLSDFFIL
jgi:hypothetical protein